jgi:dolichyl-phosphate-mannose--protein O-mannosyl transferase
VPVRRVKKRERTTERKKKNEESQQQNSVQLTGQILEPNVCAYVHTFFPSLFMHICLFLFYSTPRERCM